MRFHADYGLHPLKESLIAYYQRIVIDKKRTVGGYHVNDTGNLLCPDELCSRSDFQIDLRTYDLLELYKQRGISLRHYFDVLHKNSYTDKHDPSPILSEAGVYFRVFFKCIGVYITNAHVGEAT